MLNYALTNINYAELVQHHFRCLITFAELLFLYLFDACKLFCVTLQSKFVKWLTCQSHTSNDSQPVRYVLRQHAAILQANIFTAK